LIFVRGYEVEIENEDMAKIKEIYDLGKIKD